MRRWLFFGLLFPLVLLLSSCSYSEYDLTARYEDGLYEGYEIGYSEGYEVGHDDGWLDGYDFGYEEATRHHEYDFAEDWEEWLEFSYGITEQELCALVGFPTNTPYLTPSPSPSPSPCPTPSPSLAPSPISIGARGDAVAVIQERLNSLGFSCGVADGVFGQKTANAISEFQRASSLPVTGAADSETCSKLFLSSAATNKPTATPISKPTIKPTVKPTIKPTVKPTNKPQVKYIGNRNTYKFHYTWCSSVDLMKEFHKVFAYTRSELTSRGYVPCKRCDP